MVFGAGAPMDNPESKILIIDIVSQKRLKLPLKIMKFGVNSKKICSRGLGVNLRGLPSETKFYVLVNPSQRHIKI